MDNISGIEQERTKPAWRVSIQPVLCGFIGGTLAIGVLATLAKSSGLPLLIAPFGASCVLLFGAPDSPLAQPRNLVFGHLIASAIGLTVFALGDAGIWQMALAVGLAIAGMQLTRTVHPPAGADPLVIMLAGGASAQFLIVPVLAGVVCLLAIAWAFNKLARGKRWPAQR